VSFYGTNARPEELARQTDDNGEHQAWEDRGQEHEQEMEERHMQLTAQIEEWVQDNIPALLEEHATGDEVEVVW
jgi:hypothetical protein